MPIYMRLSDKGSSLPTIMGDVKAPGHQGWIELQSVQTQVKRGPSLAAQGAPDRMGMALRSLVVTKLNDQSSVQLFALVSNGQAMDGQIDLLSDGSQLPYLSYTLTDAYFTNMHLGKGGGGVRPSEDLTIEAAKIGVVYKAAA